MCNRINVGTKYWLAHPAWHCVTEFLVPHTNGCNSSKHFISSLVARVYRVGLISACVCFDVVFALWVTCKMNFKRLSMNKFDMRGATAQRYTPPPLWLSTISATRVLVCFKDFEDASFRMLLQVGGHFLYNSPHSRRADPLF